MSAMSNKRHIVGVGVATRDLIYRVAHYPAEDDELRAQSRHAACGGNAANTLNVLAQLGHRAIWVGTLAQDQDGQRLRHELDALGVDTTYAAVHDCAQTPTSLILVSEATGSRTIVHHRNLSELSVAEFCQVPLADCDWIHFEGRNPEATAQMIAHVQRQRPELPISIELEKPRPNIEALLQPVALLIAARGYVEAQGAASDPAAFATQLQAHSKAALCVVPWGAAGVYYCDHRQKPQHLPAYQPPQIIDTLAAGDVLNAALIDGLLHGLPTEQVLLRAQRLAGYKCAHVGLNGLVAATIAAGLLD